MTTQSQLDDLKLDFENDECEATYEALIQGYEEHFGALWPSVKHVMLNHTDAQLMDAMYN